MIRRCKNKSIIDDLQKVCLPNDHPYCFDDALWWVKWDGKKPVAFGGLKISQVWEDTGYLCRSGVIPSHRGRGLQKHLIRVRVAHAKRQGLKWIYTDARLSNPASCNSLISCGFKLYEPEEPWGFQNSGYFFLSTVDGTQADC